MKRTISVFLAMLMLALLLPFGTIETAEAATSGTCGDNLTWTLDGEGVLTISGEGEMFDYYHYDWEMTEGVPAPWSDLSYDADDNLVPDRFIKSVVIENGVTSIGSYAFEYCSALSSVTIPDSVTTIGSYAFEDCTSLKEISVSADNPKYKDIDGVLFNKAGKTLFQYPASKTETDYIIPDSVTTIGGNAFNNCTSLESITIPDSVTGIGVWAFSDCTSLTSITIPDSVTTIEGYAFYKCTSLTSISIGNSVTRIEDAVFIDCTSLKEIKVSADNPKYKDIDGVLFNKAGKTLFQYPAGKTETAYTIPDSVTTIGGNAFNNCTSLESITIPDSVTRIEYFTFQNCTSLTSITIPDSVKSIGAYAFSGCTSLTSITIPGSVTRIEYFTFQNCTSLTSITIPDSVTTIEGYTFYNCTSLESVTIGKRVTTIGWGALDSCTSLKEIKVSEDNPNYKDIDGVLFDKAGTTLIQYPFGGETNYTIPDGVTTIWYFAFDNCISLESITIPDSVTTIGDFAFDNCTSLTSITIPDSVTTIGNFAFDNCISLESAVFDGEPPTSFGERAFVRCASDFTIYYHSLYASSWTPNGRTTWNGLPIVSIESSVEEGESSIEETEPTVEDTEPSPSKHVARTVLMVVLITLTLLAIAFVVFLVIRKKKTKPSPASQDETNASFCPNCGNKCGTAANFCRKCGHKLQ